MAHVELVEIESETEVEVEVEVETEVETWVVAVHAAASAGAASQNGGKHHRGSRGHEVRGCVGEISCDPKKHLMTVFYRSGSVVRMHPAEPPVVRPKQNFEVSEGAAF